MSVGERTGFSRHPAFSHFRNMAVSIGIGARNQSWLIPSKQARLSPSKIHCGACCRARTLKHCSMASAGERCVRKPEGITRVALLYREHIHENRLRPAKKNVGWGCILQPPSVLQQIEREVQSQCARAVQHSRRPLFGRGREEYSLVFPYPAPFLALDGLGDGRVQAVFIEIVRVELAARDERTTRTPGPGRVGLEKAPQFVCM